MDGAGSWVVEVLTGSKNWAGVWLVVLDASGVVVVLGDVVVVVDDDDEDDEDEEVTSGSTYPGETQIVVVTPTVSYS